jgi:hypothetical protein
MASDIPYDWDNAAALDVLNRGGKALNWTKYSDGYKWLNTPAQSGLTNLESGGYDSTWFDIGALPRLLKILVKVKLIVKTYIFNKLHTLYIQM